jgi:potassium/hydrogen antiporter
LIITLCVLLLLAYAFDFSSSKTKIPSVILLLILGFSVKQLLSFVHISIPDLTPILPILGTIGLILIVLEGSLELELNKSKLPFVGKTSLIAFLPILIFSFGLAYAFYYYGDANTTYKIALSNAIPFAIISSAIAIPSVQNLTSKNKEFITYESSMSDIFGVIFFNFVTLNAVIDTERFINLFLQILVILVITFIATIGLAFLLSKIKHHIKFAPIILMVVLIYEISKVYHLPALIFILLFGLFLGNLNELNRYKFIEKLQPAILTKEVKRFKELTYEIVFLIRSLFFLLFGYLLETSELLNQKTIIWALLIVASIITIRIIFLKLFKINTNPLVFIAPRGLITILLFLTIPISQKEALANKSLIIQVIIISALVMMFGLMTNPKKIDTKEKKLVNENEEN